MLLTRSCWKVEVSFLLLLIRHSFGRVLNLPMTVVCVWSNTWSVWGYSIMYSCYFFLALKTRVSSDSSMAWRNDMKYVRNWMLYNVLSCWCFLLLKTSISSTILLASSYFFLNHRVPCWSVIVKVCNDKTEKNSRGEHQSWKWAFVSDFRYCPFHPTMIEHFLRLILGLRWCWNQICVKIISWLMSASQRTQVLSANSICETFTVHCPL